MKPTIFKFLFVISIATIYGFLSQNAAASEYKNRLSILPVKNPVGWTATYNPGILITDILRQSITEGNFFKLIPPPATFESNPKKNSLSKNIKKSGKTKLNHPAQFILKGRILNFTPGKPPFPSPIDFKSW